MNVKFQGNPVKLTGKEVKVGDDAPAVTLKGKDLSPVVVGGKKDKVQVVSVVPSLDTSVCAIQAKTFNKKATEYKEVEVFVVSVDLPFAQGRFCSTEGIENLQVLSDFNKKEFGEKYGVLIGDSPLEGLLTRAVFVIDKNGKVIHREICEEITKEPDYEAALDALKK